MQAEWKEEVLDVAVTRLVVAVTAELDSAEMTRALEVYRALLEDDLSNLGSLNRELAEPIFAEILKARIDAVSKLDLEARRQLLKQDTYYTHVVRVDRDVERLARRKLMGEPLSPGDFEQAEGFRAELLGLSQRLGREFPQLEALAGEKLSEAQLDCMYLLEGGAPASLRLNRFADGIRSGISAAS